jgi:DNA-directed RNA polymerase specialized sigma24 family protein
MPDVEAAYNQAWHGVYEKTLRGEEITNLEGLLADIAYNRSLDTYRQRHQNRHQDEPIDDLSTTTDLVEVVGDQHKINGLLGRLSSRLNKKESAAVSLCLLRGFTRTEAAEMLGLSDRALKKVMDSANKKLSGLVNMMQPRGCGDDEWARALRAYALGLPSLDTRDYHRINHHIEHCASCKHYVAGLRGLSVVCPPVLPFVHGPSGLLSYLRKLLAWPAHHATGGGTPLASGSSTTTAAGGTTAGAGVSVVAGNAGSGGALASLAGGGGLVKIATVAGMVLASGLAGISAVHALNRHHSAARQTTKHQIVSGGLSDLWYSPASIKLASTTNHFGSPASSSRTRKRTSRPPRRRARQSGAQRVAAQASSVASVQQSEFSFERQATGSSTGTPTTATVAPRGSSSEEEFGPEGGN